MNSNSVNRQDHAIVIGGSMAGLLAARVLADRYRRVTVVERDALPQGVENRRGVPQGRHTHGLLAGGREALDKLFPGLSGELLAAGAVPGDIIGESRWFMEGGLHCRFASGLVGLLLSRPLLEATVRERVRSLKNVEFRESQGIGGLVASEDKRRVLGVTLGNETLLADLVVDTSGRGSQAPRWLEEMGYPKPVEERVEVGIRYVTRIFRRRPSDMNGDVALILPQTPEGKRGGVALAQENDRWTVTLLTHFGSPAPLDLKGFIEFARQLHAPFLYELVRDAEPIGEAMAIHFPASVRRRYEKLDRFPEGFLTMGDAISSFNPVYGQGMSVAALEAVELVAALAQGHRDLARRFFRRASKVIDTPWSIAVGNDLRMPETTGRRTLPVRIINAYMARLHKAAHSDPVVALAFHRVGNLVAAPPSVLHPRIAWRVLWRNLWLKPSGPAASPALGVRATS